MTEVTSSSRASETGAESTRNGPVFAPVADIFETKDALVISLEMPGCDAGGLGVTLDKRVLTITGRSHATKPEGYAPTHRDYREGDYQRAFTLSEAIDGDKIEAELKEGLLRITMPKLQPAPAKSIAVKAVE
ncbi:MAG: Hsp20/alpha crystallin family protein [Rhodospirillales bacterium]|nr:Hsp20/alpha crystallin family protein [Rhodospirillales bacterium]